MKICLDTLENVDGDVNQIQVPDELMLQQQYANDRLSAMCRSLKNKDVGFSIPENSPNLIHINKKDYVIEYDSNTDMWRDQRRDKWYYRSGKPSKFIDTYILEVKTPKVDKGFSKTQAVAGEMIHVFDHSTGKILCGQPGYPSKFMRKTVYATREEVLKNFEGLSTACAKCERKLSLQVNGYEETKNVFANKSKTKYCTRCHKFKPLNEFSENKNAIDFYNDVCAKCVDDRRKDTQRKLYRKDKIN